MAEGHTVYWIDLISFDAMTKATYDPTKGTKLNVANDGLVMNPKVLPLKTLPLGTDTGKTLTATWY